MSVPIIKKPDASTHEKVKVGWEVKFLCFEDMGDREPINFVFEPILFLDLAGNHDDGFRRWTNFVLK